MIARLTGRLVEKEPHQVILEVGGVGYRASIPLSTFYALPDVGSEITLKVHTHVREDALALYAFCTGQEQALFEKLIEISGIGPRLGLAILSGLPAPDLVEAIAEGDAGRLRGIPGVGPKTADRVVLEMRDRIRSMRAAAPGGGRSAGRPGEGGVRRDVVSALVNLGYREAQAEEAVRRAVESDPGGPGTATRPRTDGRRPPAELPDLLKRSLRILAS